MQDIWLYSRNRWGVARADAYLAVIDDALKDAVASPALLRARPELGEEIVARKAGSHVAYGVVEGEVLLVVAVLHPRMDPKRHLMNE